MRRIGKSLLNKKHICLKIVPFTQIQELILVGFNSYSMAKKLSNLNAMLEKFNATMGEGVIHTAS